MYNKVSITEDIYYIGVNDRVKHLFENLWPLPYGVSYNSYLICDDKCALIDTVDTCYSEDFLHKIATVLDGRPLEYIIINHMEPDHSGSLRDLLRIYPEVKLVGNAKTFGMIKGFYGITHDSIIIKEGDSITLGKHTLNFYMTPMVHWPETMMTFDSYSNVLFSGDAFGSFGALNGGVVDYTMNTSIYEDEMIRYYSNIVGKYGMPVQKAIQKLSHLPISMICSTHGPIWKDQLTQVIARYDRLSKYEAEDGVVIVYGSMYGNTEKMADAIASELSIAGVKNIIIHNAAVSHHSYILKDIFKYKGLIIGSPTYSADLYPEIDGILKKIETREVKHRLFGYFGSFTWSSGAVRKIGEFVEKMKWAVVSEPVDNAMALSADKYEECKRLAQAMATQLKA